MKIKKTLSLVSKILFNVTAVLLGFTVLLSTIITNETVSTLLTQQVFKDKPEDVIVNTGKEPVRYKTWYSSVEDTLNGNGEIAWLAQAEGTVLLKNENGALPLSAGDKVSLYGVTAYDPMYCLDGAGNNKINDSNAYNGSTEVDRRQFFYDEFKKAGLDVNEKLANWYNSDAGKHYRRRDYVGFWGLNGGLGYSGNKNGAVPALTEANWNEIDSNSKDLGAYGKTTTAIYITGRMSNESLDLNSEGAGSCAPVDGGNNDGVKSQVDYLAFTDDEKNLLQSLGQNYDNVIVIFNQANPPQEDIPKLLEEYGIEGALWIGYPGSDGIKAVAEILTGKINPSGGLSAAWYTSRNANPSTQNYAIGSMDNVVNVEGMYVGYRYAETRYEDTLLSAEYNGNYDYDANISYPFGYGLSYSEFEYTNVELVADPDPEKNYYLGGLMASNHVLYSGNYGKKVADGELRATGASLGDCDDLIMKVTVKNKNGGVAGKEIVQIYLQQPITEQDKQHGVQKPSVQLIGYGKTKVLEPGQSETVEIKIDANKWFAAYDSRITDGSGNKGGYVLSAGDYKLVAARNSHEAVNSIYLANGGQINEKFVEEYGAGSAANVETVTVSDKRAADYKYWTQGTTDEVHNLFSDIDPNMDDKTDNDVLYFSRFNWEQSAAIQANGRIGQDGGNITGSAKGATANFDSTASLTQDNINKYAEYYGIEFDSAEYIFGWSNTEYVLADMIGVEYDPARGATEEDVLKWEQFVGQMSADDFKTLFSQGLRKTLAVPSIGKPGTNDQNASNGFEWAFGYGNSDKSGSGFDPKNASYGFAKRFDSTAKIAYPTGYPCEGIRAATFNNEIAYLVGQAMGEDGLWGGASGLYGFGLGLQRNPYHGRAGEFYSDDSFLTGMIGGYETKGAQSKGLYVYNKHFVLNDQDTNRTSYSSWLDEQTFRQIYLRPFEMAIEVGDAMNVMIAFNELGDAWTGSNYNLMTRWLRGEAGMAGFAISDYAPAEGENIGYGMLSGACLLDGDTNSGYSAGVDARYDNRLAEAATRILYTVANSNVMNFIGDDTQIYTFDPLWYETRDTLIPAISVTVYVLFGLSCAFAVGMTGWNLFDKYTGKKED